MLGAARSGAIFGRGCGASEPDFGALGVPLSSNPAASGGGRGRVRHAVITHGGTKARPLAGYSSRLEVCVSSPSASTGPRLTRRKWLPLIPPLTDRHIRRSACRYPFGAHLCKSALERECLCEGARVGGVHMPLAPVRGNGFDMATPGENSSRRFRPPAGQAGKPSAASPTSAR